MRKVKTRYGQSSLWNLDTNDMFQMPNEDGCECIYRKIRNESIWTYYSIEIQCVDCKNMSFPFPEDDEYRTYVDYSVITL